MPTIIKRKQGETGNAIEGYLQNRAGTLTIPDDATVTLDAWQVDTGTPVITGAGVTVLDAASAHVRFDPGDTDFDTVGTLELQFTILANEKPIYVPDENDEDLLLVIGPRHGKSTS